MITKMQAWVVRPHQPDAHNYNDHLSCMYLGKRRCIADVFSQVSVQSCLSFLTFVVQPVLGLP